MRRIYQIGTLFLLLSLFLAPVFECFDRWDPPGLGNDTEMAAFGLILLLCLLLAVCKLIPGLANRISVVLSAMVWPEQIAEAIHDADLEDGKFGRPEGHTMNQILRGWAAQGLPDHELLRRGMDLTEGLYHSIP